MKAFQVEREIAAAPEAVWAQLTNAEAITSGGLGVLRLDGVIAAGHRLKLWSEAAPNRAFAVRVTAFDPPRRMTWSGGMPLGLFTGTRVFTLTPTGAGARFTMTEQFSGPLAGLISGAIPDLQPSFETFADGLKRLSEGATPCTP